MMMSHIGAQGGAEGAYPKGWISSTAADLAFLLRVADGITYAVLQPLVFPHKKLSTRLFVAKYESIHFVFFFVQGFCGGAIDAIANAAIGVVHGADVAPWMQVSRHPNTPWIHRSRGARTQSKTKPYVGPVHSCSSV